MPDQVFNEKPDFAYIKKVWRRQRIPALAMGALVFTAALGIAITTKNIYRSSTAVVLDPRDMPSEPFSGKAWANATQRNFQIKFQSQEFIQRIIAEGNIKDKPSSMDIFSIFSGKTNPGMTTSTRDQTRDVALIRKVTSAINAENERDDGALALFVDWESPEEAQRIATHAMDLWILSEIEDESAQSKRRLEGLLTNNQSSVPKSVKEVKNYHTPTKDATPDNNRKKQDFIEAAQKIESLNREIRSLSEQLTSENTQSRRRRIDLEVDLERLRSKFEATHPEIGAREAELKSLDDAGAAGNTLNTELEQKRAELVALRMKAGLGYTAPVISAPNTPSIAISIAQLQAYIALLDRQISHPELNARFNIIKAATYDTAALKRRKVTTVVFGFALSLLLSLALVVYREFNNDLARDAWRVETRCRLQVWGQISSKALKKYPEISLETADLMRENLGQSQTFDEDSRTLLGYRKIEIGIRRRCKGRVIVLIEGSSKSDLRGFYTSLINIMSSDMAGKILFIDANHVTPIYPEQTDHGFLDVVEIFNHNTQAWNSHIQKAPQTGRLFDFISSGAPPKGLKTRLYNESGLKNLFNELSKSYDLIIVRGLPETHFIENSALASVSSDILMVVDSKTTSIPQITRSVNQLGESPIRGVILVGT